jgi:hypothetical protein
LVAFAPFALPRVGSLSGAAVGVDGKVRACVACGSGVCVEGFVANRALVGEGCGETYRGGDGGDEAEAVVDLLSLDIPFRELFRGPFDHRLQY